MKIEKKASQLIALYGKVGFGIKDGGMLTDIFENRCFSTLFPLPISEVK